MIYTDTKKICESTGSKLMNSSDWYWVVSIPRIPGNIVRVRILSKPTLVFHAHVSVIIVSLHIPLFWLCLHSHYNSTSTILYIHWDYDYVTTLKVRLPWHMMYCKLTATKTPSPFQMEALWTQWTFSCESILYTGHMHESFQSNCTSTHSVTIVTIQVPPFSQSNSTQFCTLLYDILYTVRLLWLRLLLHSRDGGSVDLHFSFWKHTQYTCSVILKTKFCTFMYSIITAVCLMSFGFDDNHDLCNHAHCTCTVCPCAYVCVYSMYSVSVIPL